MPAPPTLTNPRAISRALRYSLAWSAGLAATTEDVIAGSAQDPAAPVTVIAEAVYAAAQDADRLIYARDMRPMDDEWTRKHKSTMLKLGEIVSRDVTGWVGQQADKKEAKKTRVKADRVAGPSRRRAEDEDEREAGPDGKRRRLG
jgi:hypothetical protein